MLEFTEWLAEQYWGTEAAGILAFAKSEKLFLLAHRSPHVNEPNTYGIIGGKLESGESAIQGARREFFEETGYNGQMQISTLNQFHDEGFTYTNFLGIVPTKFNPNPDSGSHWETTSFEWVTFEGLLKIHPKHFGVEHLLNDPKVYNLLKNLDNPAQSI